MPPGEGELGEEPLHALFVGCNIRIHLAIGSLEIRIRDQPRASVPWACDVDHVQVMLLDQPVQVDIDEVQPRRGSPMAEEPRFDVLLGQGLLQQRVVIEVDLANR